MKSFKTVCSSSSPCACFWVDIWSRQNRTGCNAQRYSGRRCYGHALTRYLARICVDKTQGFVLPTSCACSVRKREEINRARKGASKGKVDMYLIKFSYLLYNLCINQIISTYNLLFGLLARHSLLASSGDRWYIRRYINPWIETPNNIITGGNIPPTLPLLE